MHVPILRALVLFVSLILGGVLVFFFDFYELNSPAINTGLLLVIMAAKVAYFLVTTLHWIRQTISSSYHRKYLMGFLVLQVLLIVLSFALDYYCLYQIDPHSFLLSAEQQHIGRAAQFVTFLCFSLGKYTTAGGGDMHSITPAAQSCAMGEMIVSYFTTVLIIANVGYLQALFSGVAGKDTHVSNSQEPLSDAK